jgi:cation diffusion facilitator CzcD-associated flavoprotein CzcO
MAKLPGTTVKNFIRGGAWVYYRAPPSKHMGREVDDPNPAYTEAEKEKFRDPAQHQEYRKGIVSRTNKSFYIFVKGENNEKGMRAASSQMAEKLGHDKRLCDMLIPKWELGCRRITPGPGYLESFQRDNCDCTNSPTTGITETGIQTADGEHFECDVSTYPPHSIKAFKRFLLTFLKLSVRLVSMFLIARDIHSLARTTSICVRSGQKIQSHTCL